MENPNSEFAKYRFRPKVSVILFLTFLFAIILPVILNTIIKWPDGTADGVIIAVLILCGIIFIGFWLILYRNTRPKTIEYFKRKNSIGKALLLVSFTLLTLIFFLNYYMIADVDYVDITFQEFLTDRVHTYFNLTLTEVLTDFGRFLSIIRFQLINSLICVGTALIYSPTLNKNKQMNEKKKALIGVSIIFFWILLLIILIYLGIGYIWFGTEGRNYLLNGLYDEQYSILFLPNLLFYIISPAIYLRFRAYFWSNQPNDSNKSIGKWLFIIAFLIFNILYSVNTLNSDFLFKSEAASYLIFLIFNSLITYGVILNIQSKFAEMNGDPGNAIRKKSRRFWFIALLLIIAYITIFIIFDYGLSFRISEVIAYYPNIIFGSILTGTIYYSAIIIQNKKKETIK
jgi:hypothetical protein